MQAEWGLEMGVKYDPLFLTIVQFLLSRHRFLEIEVAQVESIFAFLGSRLVCFLEIRHPATVKDKDFIQYISKGRFQRLSTEGLKAIVTEKET